MSNSLTALFGDSPDVLVLEFLTEHAEFDYNVSDIARNAGVSRPTAYKVVERLVARGALVRTRRVGASSFYRLDLESPLVKPLVEMRLRMPTGVRRRRAAATREGAAP